MDRISLVGWCARDTQIGVIGSRLLVLSVIVTTFFPAGSGSRAEAGTSAPALPKGLRSKLRKARACKDIEGYFDCRAHDRWVTAADPYFSSIDGAAVMLELLASRDRKTRLLAAELVYAVQDTPDFVSKALAILERETDPSVLRLGSKWLAGFHLSETEATRLVAAVAATVPAEVPATHYYLVQRFSPYVFSLE